MAIKKRSAIISVLANLIAPPFGHIYVGSPLRGLAIIAIGFGALLLFGWLGASSALWSFYLVQAFYLIVVITLSIDGAILARQRKNYELKFYNKWYVYIPFVLVILFLLGIFMAQRGKTVGFDNHRNVSMNMAPSLETGDFIATDTRDYVFGAIPERKEIITFLYPKDPSIVYVKRVLGLPGEKISIKNGVVHINSTPIVEPYVSISSKAKNFSQNMPEVEIPNNHIFVLGDNRDNSNDSRFWGTLSVENITGKVTLIWYAKDLNRIKEF